MQRTIVASFKRGENVCYAFGAWQYDYGAILSLQGLELPESVEIHFASTERGGGSETRVGTTKGGVTNVTIPNALLELKKNSDYNIYAFVYLDNGTSGCTEYKVCISVKARPSPGEEHPDAEKDNPFADAIKAVNEAAERVEKSKEIDRQQIAANTQNIESLQKEMKLRPEIQVVNELPPDAVDHPDVVYLVLEGE